MKKLLSLIFYGAALSAGAACAAGPAPKVNDLASTFTTVFDRNAGKSEQAFVQDFQATIAPRFPGFYGIERFKGRRTQAHYDAALAKAYAEFPAMRDAYIKKVERFAGELPGHIASFRAAFPDYPATTDVWFLHSLGEMDGGTRTIDGKVYFIFGADSMVKYHGEGDESAFFHHELFHDYHDMGCASGKAPVWASLWNEGLATYVAKRMNPSADNAQLLLDMPRNLVADTRKQLGRAWDDLHGKLESEDPIARAGLFQGGDDTGLPARRGYYLGYLVAEEIGKGMSMQQMAKLQCEAAHQAVVGAVEKLRTAHASPGQ